MSHPLSDDDDAWYVDANCPKFFDFAPALQAPCSLDREYNPPLHDFVYESDEESDAFFRHAAETPKSPLPKRPQHRMLSPRNFGKPSNRHRPKTSFEDFLRQHQLREMRKTRRSVHVLGSVPSPSPEEDPDDQGHSSAPLLDKRSRYRSLPARRNDDSAQQQTFHDTDEDHTIDLTTPTLESIVTPVTLRRTARQYTPSRVRNPSNIARSLFTSPRTPRASPLRRMRRKDPESRPTATFSGEPLRASPEELPKGKTTVDASQRPGVTDTGGQGLRLPARTTPPLSGGTIPSVTNALPRNSNKARPYIDRSAQPSGDTLPSLPLRVRPSRSVGSSSTVTPPLPQSQQSRPGSESTPVWNIAGTGDGQRGNSDSSREACLPRSQTNQAAQPLPHETNAHSIQDVTDAEEIDDPVLLHKLNEHNRRLRKSGLQPKIEFEIPSSGTASRGQKLPHPVRRNQQEADNDELTSVHSLPQEDSIQLDNNNDLINDAEDKKAKPPSLNDLLQSENERILQDRKQRLPERRTALKFNKEKVLRRIEGQRQVSAGHRKRTSARVEFTPSTAGQKPKPKAVAAPKTRPSGSIGFRSSKPKKPIMPPVNPVPQKRTQHFKMRIESAGSALPRGDQNRNPNLPMPRNAANSRSVNNKSSRTDRIKAVTKQKLEEKRLEHDLQSILSKHNNRVENNRRGRT